MYKKIFLIFYLVINSLIFSYSQNLNGIYTNKQGDYLIFNSKNQIEFLITHNSHGLGLGRLACYGNYTFKKDKIIIKSKKGYRGGSKSSYIFSCNSDNLAKIYDFFVVDESGKPVGGVYISYKYKKKYIYEITDKNGFAKCKIMKMPKDSLINISLTGYQDIRIRLIENYKEGGVFNVIFARGLFSYIEDRKVYLNYKIYGDTIKCSYMNDDLELILTKKKE